MSKKFEIGDRVTDIDSGDVGTVVQYDQDIDDCATRKYALWVLWDDGRRLWSYKDEVKKIKKPKPDTTITFKNGIKSMKKAFRGASVKYSGTFGHITGYVRPESLEGEEDKITKLYLNIYGQHYYADAIDVELL